MRNFSFQEFFNGRSGFYLEDGLFFQQSLPRASAFEKSYIHLRKKELRVYSDDEAKVLPFIHKDHPLHREWQIRKHTAENLVTYLDRKEIQSILEIGCGNGWLTRYLFDCLAVPCCGVDVNETELKQAVRVSPHEVIFLYANVFELKEIKVDAIVLASCIQYFQNIGALLTKMQELLHPGGEIHIIDSPIYTEAEAQGAQQRSVQYFGQQQAESMGQFYYHHVWNDLQPFNPVLLFDPRTAWSRLKNKLTVTSPFPWIKIPQSN